MAFILYVGCIMYKHKLTLYLLSRKSGVNFAAKMKDCPKMAKTMLLLETWCVALLLCSWYPKPKCAIDFFTSWKLTVCSHKSQQRIVRNTWDFVRVLLVLSWQYWGSRKKIWTCPKKPHFWKRVKTSVHVKMYFDLP